MHLPHLSMYMGTPPNAATESTIICVPYLKQECLSALCRASFVDVYLAYLRSYGHLKIVKSIGMY